MNRQKISYKDIKRGDVLLLDSALLKKPPLNGSGYKPEYITIAYIDDSSWFYFDGTNEEYIEIHTSFNQDYKWLISYDANMTIKEIVY